MIDLDFLQKHLKDQKNMFRKQNQKNQMKKIFFWKTFSKQRTKTKYFFEDQ